MLLFAAGVVDPSLSGEADFEDMQVIGEASHFPPDADILGFFTQSFGALGFRCCKRLTLQAQQVSA